MHGELTRLTTSAIPSVTETKTGKFAGKEEVEEAVFFVERIASGNMVSSGYRVSEHVIDKIDCNVQVTGACGTLSATKEDLLGYNLKKYSR